MKVNTFYRFIKPNIFGIGFCVLILGFFNSNILYGQDNAIFISEIISDNKIVDYNDQKLILIDFWATWCGPCYPATKHLEGFQKRFREEVFMIGMSDEPADKILSHLVRKPLEIMVVNDISKATFDKYQVVSRPFAVLISVNGEELWRGHPADLMPSLIIEKAKAYKDVSLHPSFEFLKNQVIYHKPTLGEKEKESSPQMGVDESAPKMVILDNLVNFDGTIRDFVSHLLGIDSTAIQIEPTIQTRIRTRVPIEQWMDNPEDVLTSVLNFNGFDFEMQSVQVPGWELQIIDPSLLWDSMQIQWYEETNGFRILNDRLHANNATVATFSSMLSMTIQKPVVYMGDDVQIYDWDVHYKYEVLMLEELEDSFGIRLKPIETTKTGISIYKQS